VCVCVCVCVAKKLIEKTSKTRGDLASYDKGTA